jgi:predicted enzyme related to lactoylglutathione lyase
VESAQPDPHAAGAFYRGLFGWELQDVMPPGSEAPYLIARLRGRDVAAIAAQPADAGSPAAWNTYVWVDDADAVAARVREAGGHVVMDPFDVSDAGRMAVFTDPEGAAFRVWQPGQHRGAGLVNEHGTVNFDTLHTRDLERAAAFYGAVFGWQVLPLGGAAAMWRLPGYGDHLEEGKPGLREQQAAVGAPTGFADVVASLAPIAAEEGAVGANWGVTFAVDDADATAARAVELGGTLLAAPFDAPWVRMAVIADPQGATFTASKFVPENSRLEGLGSPTVEAA